MVKELYTFFAYALVAIIFTLLLSLNYSSDFIFVWCNWLQEGFVLRDSTEWVWAIWFTTFAVTLWALVPYFSILAYIYIQSYNTSHVNLLVKTILSLCYYIVLICILFFVNDLFVSGFFIPDRKVISFEFQPGIESYLLFIFGLFFDMLQSFLIYQIIIIVAFLFKNIFLNLKKYAIFLYSFTWILFFYWFGGEGFLSDFFLTLIAIIFNQIVIFSILLLKHLRMYNK